MIDEKGWLYCDDSNIVPVTDTVQSLKSHELWLYARQDSDDSGPSTRSMSFNSSACSATLPSTTDIALSMSAIATSISSYLSALFSLTRARVLAAQKLMVSVSISKSTTTSR